MLLRKEDAWRILGGPVRARRAELALHRVEARAVRPNPARFRLRARRRLLHRLRQMKCAQLLRINDTPGYASAVQRIYLHS